MTKTTGEIIKLLREGIGWSQEELAKTVGLNRDGLSLIENNRRQIKAQELANLADALEVSCDHLLGRVPLPSVTLESLNQDKQTTLNEMRISVPAKNVQKFREVLLYILNKIGAKPNVGKTVLYKLLYFIDFDFYEKYEEQIIGATYQKNKYGPTPIEFLSIIKEMVKDEEIEKVKSKYFSKEQEKYLPLRKANLDSLSGIELNLVNEVISRLGDKNASQLSEYSHGDIPWKVTENKEIIDYETVFYRTPQYSMRNDQDEF